MVLRDCVRLADMHTFPFSLTQPYGHRTTEATQRASRPRSKLAERKVKRVEESEKWATRPGGEE